MWVQDGVLDSDLKADIQAETIASLPFPLVDEEIYEPPSEEPRGELHQKEYANLTCSEESLDDVTGRLLNELPRVQAIEALHGYRIMK